MHHLPEHTNQDTKRRQSQKPCSKTRTKPNCKPLKTIYSFVMCKHNSSHVGTAELKDINWLAVEHSVAQMKLDLILPMVQLRNTYKLTSIMSVKLIGSASPHCIPSVLSTRKATLPTLQLSYGMICLGKSKI